MKYLHHSYENSISISNFTILGFFDGKFNPEDIETINSQDLTATNFEIRHDNDPDTVGAPMESLFVKIETGGYEFEAEFPLTSSILRDVVALMIDAHEFPVEFHITALKQYSGNIVMHYADSERIEVTV